MIQSDSNLQEIVQEVLSKEMSLSAENINVDVHQGSVVLTGIVDVLAEKSLAAELVRSIPGVKNVDNSLTIGMDRATGDKEITEFVAERLQETGFDLHQISVETADGVVILRGQVESVADAMHAVKTVQSIRGIKEVASELGILPAANKDDATLTNNVELALSQSEKVDVRDVFTSTKNGEVFLSGWVDNKDQVISAMEIAASVEGVHKVHNHLASSEDTAGDAKMTKEIRGLLAGQGLRMVKAWVIDSILFMAGEVRTVEQKRKAQELARQVKGLNGVNNSIAITLH